MRSNHSSASICRVASVALVVVLAAVSNAHGQQGNGCFGRAADQAAYGWGYLIYITDGSPNNHLQTKCAPGELSPFGVVHDSQHLDNWTIHMDAEYELVISPGQIALKQTIIGQAHNARTTNDAGMSGAISANVIWWDTITPHRLDTSTSTHKYLPKPSLQQIMNNPKAYLVNLGAGAFSEPSCTSTGDGHQYWYSEVAQVYGTYDAWSTTGMTSGSSGGNIPIDKSLVVGDLDSGYMKCTKFQGQGLDTFAAFDGWPVKIRLHVRSEVNAGSKLTGPGIVGVQATSRQSEVDIPDFHICVPDPPGVEITSASGHDYSCGAGAASRAK
jgi:hypothetical protein